VQSACPRPGKLLIGSPLDDRDIGARQCQFAGQHQSGRPAAANHDRVIDRLRIGVLAQVISR
jgi:hypothetical protein